MNSRERFRETMRFGQPDRVPYFEEGIRPNVLEAWREQGLSPEMPLSQMFSTDRRLEMAPDLEPRPPLENWPRDRSELKRLHDALDPADPSRLPAGWPALVHSWRDSGETMMLRVHRGLFQTVGVTGWGRFSEVLYLLVDDPLLMHEILRLHGEFSAGLVDRLLQKVEIEAAIFSEPISDNNGPLISPRHFEEFAFTSYEPILRVLRRHGVETIIFRTYANARILLPIVLKWGFNCLWACEVNLQAMDYGELRREFGSDLRLIGGIDVDVLRGDKETIRREVEGKVPPLLDGGGYVPLADGRVRAHVPFENYVYYRRLLEKIVSLVNRS
jgi:hypothetical protein